LLVAGGPPGTICWSVRICTLTGVVSGTLDLAGSAAGSTKLLLNFSFSFFNVLSSAAAFCALSGVASGTLDLADSAAGSTKLLMKFALSIFNGSSSAAASGTLIAGTSAATSAAVSVAAAGADFFGRGLLV
jgi:hypothetical protein